MRASRFSRLTSNEVEPLEFDTWADFVAHVGEHKFDYHSKHDVPLISPAEYNAGTIRRKENVARVHFGAIDLDGLDDAQLDQVLSRVEGMEALFYTTWSHPQRPHSARLFFPFSRPVESFEWSTFWPRMRAFFMNVCDAKCSDQSRVFFYPSAPRGTESEAIYLAMHGRVFDVNALLRSATTEAPAPEQVDRQPIDAALIRAWRRSLHRLQTTMHNEWLKNKLEALVGGVALADEGERDNTIFRLVSAIVSKFPTATEDSVVALFVSSCREMGFDIEVVREKAKRLISESDQEVVAKQNAALQEMQSLISRAFNTDRKHPYSPQEVDAFAHGQRCEGVDFMSRWVVQRDTSYWIFVDGAYRGPYSNYEVSNAAKVLLSPAAGLGINVYKTGRDGTRRLKTGAELVEDYGCVASHIATDLTAQRSTFDAKTGTLIEAPTPRRLIDIEEHANVAEWLRLLGGEQHDTLLDWISVVTKLDEPCSALYLEGAKGAGKTLLAVGLSTIWTTQGPTTLEDAFAQFNSSMLKCPLVFADEAMPTDFQGRGRTGTLRQFVQARERTLKRKYVPDSSLRGCVRLILAANNKDMISTNEQLTVNDIEAIVDRVLHLRVDEKPAEYLKENRVTPEEIASHALWLCDTRRIVGVHRFLVPGTRTELHRTLTTSSGLRSAVCHWLAAYLHEPQKMESNRSLLVMRRDGSLYVTARGLARYWELYETNQDPPQIGLISRALSGLSSAQKRLLKAGDGRKTWYWAIDIDLLASWAEDNGFATSDEIRNLVNTASVMTTEAN